jgi:BirA family biotin operon repressor/biotin-[acetyl-CoA-carboxylase] ligase
MSRQGSDPHAGSAAPGPSASGLDVPDAVVSGPPGTRFSEIRRFSRIDSTNRYLLDVARDRPQDGLVAVADHQLSGRGRLGRTWEALPGANLLVSVLLLPTVPFEQLHLCSAAVSLAAADACMAAAGVEPTLKWPNDLVVGDRKLAGVLAESVPVEGSGVGAPRAVVVGVGVNVGWPPPDDDPAWASVPADLRASATSLAREVQRAVTPDALLGHLLGALDPRVGALDDVPGRIRTAQEYRARCSTLGRRVRVVLADDEVVGDAVDVTPDGHLLVDVGACITTVTAGDVVHLRGVG